MAGGGWKRLGAEEEPEAEREGVTTAALSITIFTTRRNLRERLEYSMRWPRPGLAQPFARVPLAESRAV